MVTTKRADGRTALLLIAPAMLVLLVVNIYPFLYALYISAHTVRTHLKSIFRKLGVRSQISLLERLGQYTLKR